VLAFDLCQTAYNIRNIHPTVVLSFLPGQLPVSARPVTTKTASALLDGPPTTVNVFPVDPASTAVVAEMAAPTCLTAEQDILFLSVRVHVSTLISDEEQWCFSMASRHAGHRQIRRHSSSNTRPNRPVMKPRSNILETGHQIVGKRKRNQHINLTGHKNEKKEKK